MAGFDFPNTPSVGDLFQDSSSGAVYRWNGYAWIGGVTGTMMPGYLPLAGGVMTGPLTPAPVPGIVGVSDGSNAAAGSVGEVISSSVASPGTTLSSNVVANVTSISLTAGDWDVTGEVWFAIGTAVATGLSAAIHTVSAGMPGGSGTGNSRAILNATFAASNISIVHLRPCRPSLSATTTYYLTASAGFASGTTTAFGTIWARRVR